MRQVLIFMEVFLSIKGLVSLGLNPRIESILIENRYHSLRKKLIDKGYAKNNVFVKDYVFNDKREAAIVLLGRNIPEEAERVLWFATGSYKV